MDFSTNGTATTSYGSSSNDACPLPESLRKIPERFSNADSEGVATDITNQVKSLVEAAWDGSLQCYNSNTGVIVRQQQQQQQGGGTTDNNEENDTTTTDRHKIQIRLTDAIRRCIAELDAAAMEEMAKAPDEIRAHCVDNPDAFTAAKFYEDVVAGFMNLKQFKFDKLRIPVDYDNIETALTRNERSWRSGPHKDEVCIIQQFSKRMVELAISLRRRTGNNFDETSADLPTLDGDQRQQESTIPQKMNYVATDPIMDDKWPQCVDVTIDHWSSSKFRGEEQSDDDMEDLDDENNSPWLAPRMAAKIHHVAVADGEDYNLNPRLPKIARGYYKDSPSWRHAFHDCYIRIALRLQIGLPPQPNCTAEEMAFHNIMQRVPDIDDVEIDGLDSLPRFRNDDAYGMVMELSLFDMDVLDLFRIGDTGYASDGEGMTLNDGTNRRNVPNDWFDAFDNDRFRVDQVIVHRSKSAGNTRNQMNDD